MSARRDPADDMLSAAIIVCGAIAGWAIIGAVIAWWGLS